MNRAEADADIMTDLAGVTITPMSREPRSSVTDGHGRVQCVANLCVVGSAMLRAASRANPTPTIAAAAWRAPERIAATSGDGRAA